MKNIKGILFDLDGTLLDTSSDLLFAMNELRQEMKLPALPLESFNNLINLGSKAMVKTLGLTEDSIEFNRLRTKFLSIYEQNIASRTTFFPNVMTLLHQLDEKKIPWGIVTNKLTSHTLALLKALAFERRPGCIVCGDSLAKAKPHPDPILHGCQLLTINPAECLYVGDAETDVIASKAAGSYSLIALYGYIEAQANPNHWGADGMIKDPLEILEWLVQQR